MPQGKRGNLKNIVNCKKKKKEMQNIKICRCSYNCFPVKLLNGETLF